MTETTAPADLIPAAREGSPFQGAFATWGLHKDFAESASAEDQVAAAKLLADSVAAFKADQPRTWAAEKTYLFSFTAAGKGDDGSDLRVFRIEWEGIEDRMPDYGTSDLQKAIISITQGT